MLVSLLVTALSATDANAVVARVGNDMITAREVISRAHALHVRPSIALDGLVREALIAIEARAEGLTTDPKVVQVLDAERRRRAVDQLLADAVASRVRITEAEVADRFHARADEVRLSLVVRATEQEAREALQRLQAGSGIIAEARHSIDPVGRAKSGVMGRFHRNELAPALAQAAFAAPLDRPAGPVGVKKGYAVFVVHERKLGDDAALQREGPELRRQLEAARRDEQTERFVRLLRARAHATVDAVFLRSTGDGLNASEDDARHVVATEGPTKVTYGEVLARIRASIGGGVPLRRESSPEAKQNMAWRIVDSALLEQEAVRRRLDRRKDALAEMRGITRTVLARSYAFRTGELMNPPSEREIEAQYRNRPDDYWIPAHRMCVVLDASSEQDAQRMRSRLLAGEHVDRVASEYTEPMGPHHGIEPVAFDDARLDAMSNAQNEQHVLAWTIRKAEPGVWTPVESGEHWHLVRCDAKEPTRRRALSEARDEIVAAIRQQRVSDAIDARVAERRRTTRIETYPRVLSDEG